MRLEDKLRRQLYLPRRHRIDDLSEACAADISVDGGGAEELRMIEDVEGLDPELEDFAFRERSSFCSDISKLFNPGP